MPVIATARCLEAHRAIDGSEKLSGIISAFDGSELRHRCADLLHLAALLQLVLSKDQGVGLRLHAHALGDELVEELVRHVFVIKGGGGSASADALDVIEVLVIPDLHVAEDLGGGRVRRASQHAGRKAQLDGFGVHHARKLTIADHGENGHALRVAGGI